MDSCLYHCSLNWHAFLSSGKIAVYNLAKNCNVVGFLSPEADLAAGQGSEAHAWKYSTHYLKVKLPH